MRQIDKGILFLGIILLSIILSFAVSGIFTFNIFPYLGLTLLLSGLSSFIFLSLSKPNSFQKLIYILILIISVFISIRVSLTMVLLNLVASFYLLSVLTVSLNREKWSAGRLLLAPILALISAIGSSSYATHKDIARDVRWGERVAFVLKSLAISVGILVLLIPLLSSVNSQFATLMGQIFSFDKLFDFLKISGNQLVLTFFGAIILIFLLPKVLSLVNSNSDDTDDADHIIRGDLLLIPKVLTICVLLLFIILQAQVLANTAEYLQSIGTTNSKITNESFLQLALAILIVFSLIYYDGKRNLLHLASTALLLVGAAVLLFFAAQNDLDYIEVAGFTQKRLLGIAFLVWIGGLLTYFALKLRMRSTDSEFLKGIVIFSGVVLVLVNLANIDYLIFNFNRARVAGAVDYEYLSGLSADARSYPELLEMFSTPAATGGQGDDYAYLSFLILSRTRELQSKYRNLDLRSFNMAEYLEHQRIRDIDIDLYRKRFKEIYGY